MTDERAMLADGWVRVPRELLREVLEDATNNVHMAAIEERARIAELRKVAGLDVKGD